MKHISLLLMALLPCAGYAQTGSTAPAFVEHSDSAPHVLTMHENAPKKVNTPDVPRFATFGKEGKFYMGIGVNIKATAVYDIGNPVSDPNLFVTSDIPMHKSPGNGSQFKFSAQQSSIYLNVVALPGNKDQIGAFVQVNFMGHDYTPSLYLAYLKYRGFTAGYNFSSFSDLGAAPSTIDFQGPNAFTCMDHGMVGYEKTLGKKGEWTVGGSLDMPENSYTNAEHTASVNQRVPDIPFFVQRNWSGGKGWFRLSGIVRNLYYRDLKAAKNIDKVGWGIKASGTTPVVGGLKAYWQCVYGKGIASYIQDLSGCGMDLMPDPDNSGRLQAVKAWAGYGALQYNFSPKLFCTAIYSHVRTYARHYTDSSTPWATGYKYAQYVVGNVFYNLNSIVQLGAEYIYGRRVDYSGLQAHDNRIEAMIQVSF